MKDDDPMKPVVQFLRTSLRESSDEDLAVFLSSYASGHITASLIKAMSPAGRSAFFEAMRKEYPELFAPAPTSTN